jgi:tetratricopeptide (TPR) repeat protein
VAALPCSSVLHSFVTGIVMLALSASVAAQQTRIEITASGEHRMAAGDTAESARALALANAQRQAIASLANALPSRLDLTSLKLSPDDLQAYVAATADIAEAPAAAKTPAGSPIRVAVTAQFDLNGAAHRLTGLRKDEDAWRTVVNAWTKWKDLHQQNATLATLNVTRLVARGTAALARTELSTIGGRTPSAEGRRRAKEYADAALTIAPDAGDARALLGDLFVDAEDPVAAEAEYRRAIANGRSDAAVRIKLAEALRLQGKFEESTTELRDVIRATPDHAQAHSDLAMILRAEGNVAEAEAEYREAIRLDPRNADAHNGLAITYAGSKRPDEAVKEFEAIIAIDPDSTIGYYNLATVLANLDRDIEAAAALRQVIRIYPDHYNARFNLGELLRLEGKFDDSAAQFREYLRLAPETSQNRRNIDRARRYVQQFTNP